jgi:hypothetical protein
MIMLFILHQLIRRQRAPRELGRLRVCLYRKFYAMLAFNKIPTQKLCPRFQRTNFCRTLPFLLFISFVLVQIFNLSFNGNKELSGTYITSEVV